MKPKAVRKRLDLLLVERGCAESAQKAMAMILAGEVQVDGQRVEKAGIPVAKDARIEITSRLQKFVSRGGVKLEGALEDLAIDPDGCVCLDIGASNGGFTDCLLQHGAERVYAVDVNVEQLDWKLSQNPLSLLRWIAWESARAASWGPKAIRSIFYTHAKRAWGRIADAHASRTILSIHRHHFGPTPFGSRRCCSPLAEMA